MTLPEALAHWLPTHATTLGLTPTTARAEPILNWGGFYASSFRLTDGIHSLHLKLAPADGQAPLRRWYAVHPHLTAHYRAPRVLAWVDIPHTDYGGLLCEALPGATWNVPAQPALAQEAASLLNRLHHDETLAAALNDAPVSLRTCWEQRYHDQFAEGLALARAHRPPFVSAATLAWMEQEAQRVLALADHPAFDGVTAAPCHGDLWAGNILVAGEHTWWLLDWDGIGPNDPALDHAMLAWPLVFHLGANSRDLVPSGYDSAFHARLALHLRATTLDYVIDPLADWAECAATNWADLIRPRKQAEHLACLDWYRRHW